MFPESDTFDAITKFIASSSNIFGPPYYQIVILALLSLLLPLSIFVGRRNVRVVRLRMLENLEKVLNLGSRPPLSFAIIRARYDDKAPGLSKRRPSLLVLKEIGIYALPTIIFAVLSACGFALLLHLGEAWGTVVNNLLRGLRPGPNQDYDEGLFTGLIVGAAFVGAYIWSIKYLILRIGNYDLRDYPLETGAREIPLSASIG